MKKISVIGLGKQGLCFALNLERYDTEIVGIDTRPEYIKTLNERTFKSDDPEVNGFLAESKIKFTTSLSAIRGSYLVFIVIEKPSYVNGLYDHFEIDTIFNDIRPICEGEQRMDFVICSTTMPGYCELLTKRMNFRQHKISYNPTFICQDTIMKEQQQPDMVLIGAADQLAAERISERYYSICINQPSYNVMTVTEAEIAKIALNSFIATKIAFANLVGDIAFRSNCNPEKILSAMGTDSRVGSKCFEYGYGFGGPSLPRDNNVFGTFCQMKGVERFIPLAAASSNIHHIEHYADFMIKDCHSAIFNFLSYKPESTSIEESQALKIAEYLSLKKKNIVINEERTSVIEAARKKYPDLFPNASGPVMQKPYESK